MTYGAEVLDNLTNTLEGNPVVALLDRWNFNGATSGVVITLTNGLGLSVAIGPMSYGGRSGLFESVELDANRDFVGFTDGWLDVSDVVAKVEAIAAQ